MKGPVYVHEQTFLLDAVDCARICWGYSEMDPRATMADRGGYGSLFESGKGAADCSERGSALVGVKLHAIVAIG